MLPAQYLCHLIKAFIQPCPVQFVYYCLSLPALKNFLSYSKSLYYKLLLIDAGDIETNPGPQILKAILGSFHQGPPKFGSTAGIQCSCNALFSIYFSVIKKVTVWKTWELDYILENGDKLFKSLNIPRSLLFHELPLVFAIENQQFDIEMLMNSFGLLNQHDIFEDRKHMNSADIGNGLIFMTGGYSISLIWSKNSIFFV